MTASLPESMTFIKTDGFGAPEVLKADRMAVPQPGAGEVLVKVAAAGVNRPDIQQRKGAYPPPPGASAVPGLEIAGTVVAVGEGATRYRPGDRVCALVASGGYAEYCVAPEPQVLPVPEGWSLLEAGGLPETYFTVWTNLFDRGRLQAGESVLVHGGSSGIGTTAIQLASLFGARVFATVGNADKQRACLELGAERVINYREEDFVAVVKELTGGKGVDVVLDMVGADYVARNLDCLAVEGRLLQIAWMTGAKVSADLTKLMVRRLTWTGSTLRPRSVEEKGAIARSLEEKVWPLLEARKARVLIHKTFPLEEAAAAHALMESSSHIGKILLTTGDEAAQA
ncbi:NAD(P)H-quinone oxidoreductase [Marinimicrococcus flavescens]|uniref:NAD(P)H-quinone oxidoreductase n=1 Tax=Marinimicrococcus flavescens TaxID=3031815 RepID=A0AAP3XPG6_9PROT|nr:NAD(P)H-quinone oxidoreductase [Marinimicrococcus flavescens]